jgi:hypothetical protein
MYRKRSYLWLFPLTGLALGGCAGAPSTSEWTPFGALFPRTEPTLVAPTAPIPLPKAPESFGIGQELTSLLGMAHDYTAEANRALPPDIQFRTDSELLPVAGGASSGGAKLDVEMITDERREHLFPPGGYLIRDVEGAAYVTFVTGLIQEAYRRFEKYYQLTVLVDYLGAPTACRTNPQRSIAASWVPSRSPKGSC